MRSRLLITSAALMIGTVFAFGQGASDRQIQQPGATQSRGQSKQETQGGERQQHAPSTSGQAQRNEENRAQGPVQQEENRPQGQVQQKENRTQGQVQQKENRTRGQVQQEENRTRGQVQQEENRTRGQVQQKENRTQGQVQQKENRTQGQVEQRQNRTQGQTQREPTQAQREGGGSVTLTSDQRTKIRQTVIGGGNAPRVDRVDFSLNVGTVVPRRVRVLEVPPTLVEIHPAWRGYRYFVYQDEIVIVDPESLMIVAIVNV